MLVATNPERSMRQFPLIALPLLAACAVGSGTAPASGLQLGPEPLAYHLVLDPPLRKCVAGLLAEGRVPVLRLHLEGLRARQAKALKGVRLLLGPSGAQLSEVHDGPHTLGAFALGLAPEESQVWNLGPLLARQWVGGERSWAELGQLQLRLLPDAWEGMRLPPDFSIGIQRVWLQSPDCPAPMPERG
jgi:hypothetical protein